jgi:hypothetical protein
MHLWVRGDAGSRLFAIASLIEAGRTSPIVQMAGQTGIDISEGQHGVVELLEEGVVFFLAVGGGEAERLDAFVCDRRVED